TCSPTCTTPVEQPTRRHKNFGNFEKKIQRKKKKKQITGEAYSQDLALWWVLESLREALQ
ncbi:MAG: hypothetical protein OEM65_09685, partial [Desulfuromonadales bacterium]|nr:hypothetical protein [Desulfuromonadales bacterium]